MSKDINERINLAKAKMGTVIKDFQSSDAPQFKGKSKEKRRQMAIAAKLEAERGPQETNEDLRKWFGKGKEGDWVRVGTDGEIKGACAREPGEGKPKCMPRSKAHSMDKDDRATAARRKRRKDPVADRRGKGNTPIMVNTEEFIPEGNEPTNPALWSKAKSLAKKKFDVYPSAYANGWAAKYYKSKGGSWKSVKEETVNEKCWDGYKRVGMKKKGNKMVPNCVPEEAEYTAEAKDEREYGFEGDMAMSQLRGIMSHAEQLHNMLKPDTDLPEWVQSKITLAYDYMQTAADYMATEMNEEVDLEEGVKGKPMKDSEISANLQRYGYNKRNLPHLAKRLTAIHKVKHTAHGNKIYREKDTSPSTKNSTDSYWGEEVEQIDEFMGKIPPPGPESIAHRNSNTAMRLRVADERRKARLAKKKATMEEVEQIDEISKTTLKSYSAKAEKQTRGNQPHGKDALRKRTNREKGLKSAYNKYYGHKTKVHATEEVELQEGQFDYSDMAKHLVKRYGKNITKKHVDSLQDDLDTNQSIDREELHAHIKKHGGAIKEELGKDNEWGRPELRKKFASMTPGQDIMANDTIPEMDVFKGTPKMKEENLHEISQLGAKKRAQFQAKIRKTLSDPKKIAKAKKQVAKKKAAEAEKPKNLLHQLHKTQSLNDYKVHFHSGEKETPHPAHVRKFMDKYHSLKSSIEKEALTNRAHKSHDDFKKVVNEECNQCEMENNGVNPRYDDVMNKDSGGRIDDYDIVQLEHDVMTDIDGLTWEDMVDQYEDSELVWIDDPILDGGEGSEEVSTGELSKLVYPATQEVAEALTPQGRLKKKFAAIRTKSRRTMARNLALKRVSSPDRLKKRAVRSARNMVYKRLLRGRDRSTLSAAEKSRVEAMVKRFAPMVSRLTIRLIPKERKIEQKRLVNRSKRNQAKKR